MKLLLMGLFLSITTLFSSSPHLADAQCSIDDKQMLYIHFRSGDFAPAKTVGWGNAFFKFNQKTGQWNGEVHKDAQERAESLSLVDVQTIIGRVKQQGETYSPNLKKGSLLCGIGYILKGVQYRDPVRFDTFCDGINELFRATK
jgi:hypothetical protein